MKNAVLCYRLIWLTASVAALASAQNNPLLTIRDSRFELDSKPFPFTGVTFFNAIYNPAFNRDSATRRRWMEKFRSYGINVFRVWAQWDCHRGFADSTASTSLYFIDGKLRQPHVETLKHIAQDAGELGMCIELTLFSQESWHDGIRLSPEAADRAVASLTNELKPYRNITFQVWNEFSERTIDHIKTIKSIDPQRLVTTSPGGSGVLSASDQETRSLDYLSPHTSRQSAGGRHWEIAPTEIAYLLKRYRKPVVDDEPARTGTRMWGGPTGESYPIDHIIQIYKVWQLGAYIIYHHDMFQTGYGTSAVPPNGIPDPEFSPYHKAVFEYIRMRDRFVPEWYGRQ
jgi:hypothetical protein